jgi:AraC-like DNA-binding protein
LVQRYVSPNAGLIVDSPSLRHPEFAFRRSSYSRVIVDERLLTGTFPLMRLGSRLQSIVLLEGLLHVEHEGRVYHVAPGEAWLFGPSMQKGARFENATFLDLEWATSTPDSVACPTRLAVPEAARLERIAAGIEGDGRAQRDVLRDVFDFLKVLGAPVELSRGAWEHRPPDRDLRIAFAMETQLANLATEASTLELGEDAQLSPRQLQRLVRDFNVRYSINAGNWRDTRNRWRLQIAAVLLSLPELSIAAIAEEVGYRSSASLARAFEIAGFPSPGKVRERLLG